MPYICFDALNFLLFMQCASAIDNFATFYFNHVTVGESVTSPVALSAVGLIAEFPELFSRVSLWLACCLDSSLFPYNLQFVNRQLQDCQSCIIAEVRASGGHYSATIVFRLMMRQQLPLLWPNSANSIAHGMCQTASPKIDSIACLVVNFVIYSLYPSLLLLNIYSITYSLLVPSLFQMSNHSQIYINL